MFIIQHSPFSIMGSPWGQRSCLADPFLYTMCIAQYSLEPRRCSRNSCWMRNVLNEHFPEPSPGVTQAVPGPAKEVVRWPCFAFHSPLGRAFTYVMEQQWNPTIPKYFPSSQPSIRPQKGGRKSKRKRRAPNCMLLGTEKWALFSPRVMWGHSGRWGGMFYWASEQPSSEESRAPAWVSAVEAFSTSAPNLLCNLHQVTFPLWVS